MGVALFAVACGDDPIVPSQMVGVYQLVSVNGQPLPWASPPSTGFGVVIDRGDLHLRSNGTFALGIGGNVGTFMDGTFRGTSTQATLTSVHDGGSQNYDAVIAGDSAIVHIAGWSYGFRRTAAPGSAAIAGTYALTSINGRGAPFTLVDTVVYPGLRHVERAEFDTLHFVDQMFYRQHRSITQISWSFNGDSTVATAEGTGWGRYHAPASGVVVLRPYNLNIANLRDDTLQYSAAELLRRKLPSASPREERYVRQ